MPNSEALSAFISHVNTLRRLFRFFDARIDQCNAEEMPLIRRRLDEAGERLTAAGESYPESKDTVDKEAADLARAVAEYISIKEVVELQHRWYVAMLVTITEAYLLDALVEAAGVDTSLVEKSEQKLTYAKLAHHDSLDGLAKEMRTRWARHFIDSGGPSCWIDRLTRMGACGYSDGLPTKLEQIWGVRHLIVHRAGRVNADFSRRYPDFPKEKNGMIIVDGDRVTETALSVIEFAGVTDRYLMQRCEAKMAE